jgi:hypothetical protein
MNDNNPTNNDKVRQLYDALKADGGDVGTPEEFTNWFYSSEDNRKYVYETFKADGDVVGEDYNEFSNWLAGNGEFSQQSSPVEKIAASVEAPAGGSVFQRARAFGEQQMNKAREARKAAATPAASVPAQPQVSTKEEEKPFGPERFKKSMEMSTSLNQQQQNIHDKLAAIRTNPFDEGHEDVMAPAREERQREEYQQKVDWYLKNALMPISQSKSAIQDAWLKADVRSANDWKFGRVISNEASRLRHHDIDVMTEDAWNNIPESVRERTINNVAGTLRESYGLGYDEAYGQAEKIVRGEVYKMMYDEAVRMRAPRSWAEYLLNKVNSNSIGSLLEGIARSKAGTVGDMLAEEQGMEQYRKDNWFGGLAGDVLSFGVEAAGLVGGAGAKLGAKAASKMLTRKFMENMTGKLVMSGVTGGLNLGIFNAIGEASTQFKHGGAMNEDGTIGDYSLGNIGESALHGLGTGVLIGPTGQLFGNAGVKLAKKAESTAGKALARGAMGVGSALAEGTIFVAPEMLSGELTLDDWLGSVALMGGFKVQGGLKSARKNIMELSREGRAGFETRLRSMLERSSRPDYSLTKDEKLELAKAGYGDLAELVEGYKNTSADQRAAIEGRRPVVLEANENGEIPYNRFIELVEDKNVSEAARAKMYYYVTGHGLPMSTVMGSTIGEYADANGNVKGYVVQSFGKDNGVITSKTFKNKKDADMEVERINRQAELNGVVVGEQTYNNEGNRQRTWDACEVVANRKKVPHSSVVKMMERVQADPSKVTEMEKRWAQEVQEVYDALPAEDYQNSAALMKSVGEKYNVDVNKALRKEPNRRSDAEQKALKEYTETLYADAMKEPQPYNEKQLPESFQRGYDTDEQNRTDIAIEMAEGDSENAKEAWEGVEQRIKDDADFAVAQIRETYEMMKHDDDGSVRPATIKSDSGEHEVYIKSGDIVTNADGTVDPEKSEQTIVVYDPVEGKNKQISPIDIVGFGEVTSADDNMASFEMQRQEMIKKAIDAAKGVVTLEPGQRYTMPDGSVATVMAVDGESVTLQMADGTQTSMPLAEVQRLADELMVADYNERHPKEEPAAEGQTAETTSETVEGVPEAFVPEMELTLKDGRKVYVTTGERQSVAANGYVENPEGRFIEVFDPAAENSADAYIHVPVDDVKSYVPAVEAESVVKEAPAEDSQVAVEEEQPVEQAWKNAKGEERTKLAVEAARNGDVEAQESLEKFGIKWEKKPVHRYVSQGEVDYILGGNRYMGRNNGNVDVTNSNEPTSAADASYRIVFKDDLDWATNNRLAMKNEDLGDGYIHGGYDINDVARIERRNEDGTYTTVWDAENPTDIKQSQAPAIVDDNSVAMPMVEVTKGRGKTKRVETTPDWYAATPSRAQHYIYNELGFTPEVASEVVKANMDEIDKAIADKQKKEPKPTANPVAYKEAHDAWEDEMQTLRDHRQYWNEVRSVRNRQLLAEAEEREKRDAERKAVEAQRRAEEEAIARQKQEEERAKAAAAAEAEEEHFLENEIFDGVRNDLGEEYRRGAQERKDKLDKRISMKEKVQAAREIYGEFFSDDVDVPADIYELVAKGMKGMKEGDKINWDMVDGNPGLKQELGSNMTHDAVKNRKNKKKKAENQGDFDALSAFISFDNKGKSLKQVAHEIWQGGDNVQRDGSYLYADDDIANALMELLLEAEKTTDITQYAFNNRVNSAETAMESKMNDEVGREVEWRIQQSGMTFAEYLEWYKDMKEKDAAVEGMTEEEYTNIIIFGENGNRGTEESIDETQPSAPVVGTERPRESGDDGRGGEESSAEVRGTEGERLGVVQDAGRGDEEVSGGEGAGEGAGSVAEQIAAQEVNENPTEGQKEAGNYKKAHVRVDGFDVTIENKKGSVRSGVDADGHEWSQTMANDYGYIRGTEGVDGDHIDLYLSDTPEQGDVFVIDQVNPKTGEFDEHKVMYGFPDMESARQAYLDNYEEGWQGLGAITPVSKDEFKKWIESSHRKTKPFSEYKSVETLGDVQVENMPAEEQRAVDELAAQLDDHNSAKNDRLIQQIADLNTEASERWLDENVRSQKVDGRKAPLTKVRKAINEQLDEVMGDMLGEDYVTAETPDEVAKAEMEIANGRTQMAAPAFYSNAMRAVEGIKQEKATAEQWLKMIEKAGGLKAGEDKWTGLSEWLKEQKGSLTKQEVMDYIRENQIQVEEVNYGEKVNDAAERLDDLIQEYKELIEYGRSIDDEELYEIADTPEDWAFEKMVDAYGKEFRKAFKGSNENLIPQKDKNGEICQEAKDILGGDVNVRRVNNTRLHYTTDFLDNKREIALVVPNIEPWNEGDEVHFGDAGEGRAVAWVRFGDTTVTRDFTKEEMDVLRERNAYLDELREKYGEDYVPKLTEEENKKLHDYQVKIQKINNNRTQRVLVIDEIQSNRHQEGREKGYKGVSDRQKLENIKKRQSEIEDRVIERQGYFDYNGQGMTADELKEYEQLHEQGLALEIRQKDGIPDAPFDKNWHEVAMKRMLRYAAENGYDKVAWTKGEQQAERYNIGNAVESIEKVDENTYIINTKDGTPAQELEFDEDGVYRDEYDATLNNKSMEDIFGKELAKKLQELPEGETLKEDGLRIGGEGMNGFYDQILPRFMDKYGKKWGVKTGEVELPDLGDNGLTMWSVDVTPEMRESVMEGQPMFFKTADGTAYGFTKNGKIYIDKRIATPETRIHEYAHLWAQGLRKRNQKAWEQLKNEMEKQADVMAKVKELYPELVDKKNPDHLTDEMMEEVFAHYSGKRGAERLEKDMREEMAKANGIIEKAQVATVFAKIKDLLSKFWNMARDLFAGKVEGIEKLSGEDFADMALGDLLRGFDPREVTTENGSDKAYMEAVERGDMETAQRMVNEAAKAAMPDTKVVDENGNPLVVYHGTGSYGFNTFKERREWNYDTDSEEGVGIFFSTDKSNSNGYEDTEVAEELGFVNAQEGTYSVFLNLENPLVVDFDGAWWNGKRYTYQVDDENGKQIQAFGDLQEAKEFVEQYNKEHNTNIGIETVRVGSNVKPNSWYITKARQNGNDGVIFKNIKDSHTDNHNVRPSTTIAVFNPSQIKSADPVTYDDNGNVIPLSERFNNENADIRYHKYATKDGAQLSMMSLFEGNENVDETENASGDLSNLRLRKLQPGETCLVERRYEENKSFSFTGKERIESMDDVAYIFKQLENAAVENSFIALVKDGKPTIIHTGMGGYNYTPVEIRQAMAAYETLKPEKVYFIHNHPSGTLKASGEDRKTLQEMSDIFGDDVVQDGIIIDTTSGKYGVFGYDGEERDMPESADGEVPMKVYEFSKQVFGKDWKPQNALKITNSKSIAEFISSQRCGEHPKMSFIIVNNQLQVVGNLFLPWTKLSDIKDMESACRELSSNINLAGGMKGIIYGNYQYEKKDKRLLQQLTAGMKALQTPLLDVVHVDVNDGLGYHSAHDEGVMEPEEVYVTPKREAGEDIFEYAKRIAEDYRAYNALKAAMEAVNGGVYEAHDPETEGIWNDKNLTLDERITANLTRLALLHKNDEAMKNRAYRAIGGNLANLRKAMSLQKEFDKTTVKRVADLARVLIQGGYFDGATKNELGRLLTAVKNATGHADISNDIRKVMDIMIASQLRNAEESLRDLEKVKASKVDAKGVEVQGALDVSGQQTMKTFKETRGWSEEEISQAMAEAENRMASDNRAIAEQAFDEYTGLRLALAYVQNIKASIKEERDLKQALDDARHETDRNKEYENTLLEAIQQNKVDRIQAYHDIIGRLSGVMSASIENAKAFKEADKERVREIQHNANSDMEGKPSDEHYKPEWKDKFVNNSAVQFFFKPLATFDQMLRLFGSKSANGEGYLYNRFMRGWVDAREKEIRGVREKYAELDAKVQQIFGDEAKSMADLIRLTGKMPKATVLFKDGGEMKEHTLTQGNLMYIYMVNKMLDGRMKLRKMGIDEKMVADIERMLDPRLIELADWMQNEFLVNTRNEYNETHKRVFGASMAAIEDYFPLKINANARVDKAEDLDDFDKNDGISTKTGSIIKRRMNALALDITNADALNVILDHVAQMEHWNAFAEFNRDLNTLRTYKHFRNQVKNMTTIYGSGDKLWQKFNDVSQMAAGTYRPKRADLDVAATNLAKGVTAAKVSFRIFTALKQFLSMPAYLSEARPDLLAKNIAMPWKAWSWAMDNLPIFEDRWNSRIAGDPRLMKSELDWKGWRNNVVQIASRIGMSPNAFVDALTVSIGAHAIYETKKGKYLKEGYSEEQAEQRAKQDAEVAYNQTQQSSEGAFTSTMQVDRSWLSVMLTVFRNASMAYQRQLHDAVRNLKRDMTKGNKKKSIEFMTKQMIREGVPEDKAEDAAESRYNRQIVKDGVRVAVFGYIMQFCWNLGAYLPYLLFGDDDDEKSKMWDDVFAKTYFGWSEGLTGGDVISEAGKMLQSDEGKWEYLKKEMPVSSDLANIFKKVSKGDWGEIINDMVNLAVQAGVGVNPQSITDAVLAIMDACGDDPALAHETAIAVMRILQVPQSQIKKMYFDELGLSGEEVSQYTPEQLARRYAEYQVKRGHMLTPWNWDNEALVGKKQDAAMKTIKEKIGGSGDEEVNEAYKDYSETAKNYGEQLKELRSRQDYKDGNAIEKAEMLSEYNRENAADHAVYATFESMDKVLSKMTGYYLGAKTTKEAQLCRKAMDDYKKQMVAVMGAKSDEEKKAEREKLADMIETFYKEYGNLQSTRTKEEKVEKEMWKMLDKIEDAEAAADEAEEGNQ